MLIGSLDLAKKNRGTNFKLSCYPFNMFSFSYWYDNVFETSNIAP